ncbi:MAG: hypothetical protein ACK4P4_01225 [Allorhizobium sp.]
MTTYTNHPIIAAASAAGATLVFCGLLTFTWIVPTMVESAETKLEIQSRELEEEVAKNLAAEKRISAFAVEVRDLKARLADSESEKLSLGHDAEREIADLKREIFSLEKSNSFIAGSPYPFGFDKVRIGDPVSKIAEAYSYPNESEVSGSIYFDLDSDLWEGVRFAFDRVDVGVVEAISFSIGTFRGLGKNPKPALPENWIEDTLIRALGVPHARIGPDNLCLAWRLEDPEKTLIFHFLGESGFMISNKLSPSGCYITKEQRKEMDDASSSTP